MLKRGKDGRFRKMPKRAAQKLVDELQVEADMAPKLPYLQELAKAPPSLARRVDILAESHELADLLVAIRDKVQRIADEAAPLDASRPSPDLSSDVCRQGLLMNLGMAIRNARRMKSWVLPLYEAGKAGLEPPTIGGPGSKPVTAVQAQPFITRGGNFYRPGVAVGPKLLPARRFTDAKAKK